MVVAVVVVLTVEGGKESVAFEDASGSVAAFDGVGSVAFVDGSLSVALVVSEGASELYFYIG